MRNRDHRSTTAAFAFYAFTAVAMSVPTQTLAAVMQAGPAAIYAGPVAITPTTGFETKYRDNIYLQENDTIDSWIFVARPAVNAAVQDRENRYQVDYKGEGGWYQEDSSNDRNDYFDHTFSGDAHMEFSERRIVDVYASWASLHEDRGTGLTEGLVGEFISEGVKYDQSDVGGSLQLGSNGGGARLQFRAGYMDREYQNFEEITRTRDRDETTLGTTFFYPIAPKTDLLAEYTYKDIHYPNPFEDAPPLDSHENSLLVGAQWEMTPNLKSTVRVGYGDKSFDDSERENWDGVAWSVALWMKPREQDTILVETSRAPEETTREGDFINRAQILATWTHDWSARVYTELGALYGQDEYEQSVNDRKDDIYNVSFRAGYAFRRWANVYVGYSYDDKDSSAQNLSYSDNTFMIGVDFSL
jgi:hypothetical protein